MKCLLNPSTGEVRRVSDPSYLLASGWQYCTKTLWKTYRNREAKPLGDAVKDKRSIRRV